MTGRLNRVQSGAAFVFSWLLTVICNLEILASGGGLRGSAELISSKEPGWPQFRGLRRDGRSDEGGLLRSWPIGGPTKLWQAKGMGRGYSSPIIVQGRIYITGDVQGELQLFALDGASGQLLWTSRHGAAWKDPYPGARATPTYSEGRLYLQNAHGRVGSFDAQSGREVWGVDLLERFRGKNITWGMSECLVVDERAVYATAGGGDALVVALDKKTGAVVWKSEALHDSAGDKSVENASYVSPILVSFAGKRLLIGCSMRHLFCIDAVTGEFQWTRRVPTAYSVLAMMPVLMGDAVFMTAPHGKPGGLFRLVAPDERGGKVGFEEVWETRLDTCQGGVVQVGEKLVGSFYPGRKGWAAVDGKSGEVLYQAEEIVKGAVLYADKRLYVLSENGVMSLLEAGENRFENHGQFRLARADNDAWAHPVILEGRLYLRYHEELECYDIRAR